jgi:pyrroloquinoline quinone biosynthesis protein B
MRRAVAALLFGLAPACAAPERPAPERAVASAAAQRPYVLVLGTAQDGGLPQVGCREPPCEAARRDPALRRLRASLLVVDPASSKRWLVDATPDLREQVELCRDHPPARRAAGPRPPLFDGVFLTHAHVGHYAGLVELGREVYGAEGLAVFASRPMRDFLAHNGPWSLMVELGGIALLALEPGQPVPLTSGLRVTPLAVPHRREFTDTLAFVIEGPQAALLYVPDIDRWEDWDQRIEELVERVDVALVDGTFFSAEEMPGRDLSQVPHPMIQDSIRRFALLPAAERAKIHFTHLNHTNPAAREGSPEAAAIRAAGLHVAREGQRIEL